MGIIFFLPDFVHSTFRDFESYLRILGGLNEDDIQLKLKQNFSKFITLKFLQAFTHLKIFLKFFQDILKPNLGWIIYVVKLIQLSSIVTAFPF